MEEANAIISSFIAADEPRDESVVLNLKALSETEFSATLGVGPATADPPISFQIFFDQSWNPIVCPIHSPIG